MLRIPALVLAALLAAAPALAADTVTITLPPDREALQPGPGVEVTQRDCQLCHSTDYITMQPRGGAAQWQGVVTKMIKVFGAPISEADARVIVEYLVAHYGPGR